MSLKSNWKAVGYKICTLLLYPESYCAMPVIDVIHSCHNRIDCHPPLDAYTVPSSTFREGAFRPVPAQRSLDLIFEATEICILPLGGKPRATAIGCVFSVSLKHPWPTTLKGVSHV